MDLNRDFPDPFERGQAGIVQPSGTEQPETLVLMRWIREGRFVVSASMHEAGTLFDARASPLIAQQRRRLGTSCCLM